MTYPFYFREDLKGIVYRELDTKFFPYRLRNYQVDFFKFIQREVMSGYNIVVDAATGFGKTPLILGAILPHTLETGYKILWIVRTGNETDRPIEELKEIASRSSENIFGFSFRGKKDMCLLVRELIEENITHEDARVACETYRGSCPYYLNFLHDPRTDLLVEDMIKEPKVYSEIFEKCREFEICPYYVQIQLMEYADVISMSYNYVLDSRIRYFIKKLLRLKRTLLVVDEAHNLQNAAGSLYSDRITERTLDRALGEVEEYEVKNLLSFIDIHREYFGKLKESIEEDMIFDFERFIGSFGSQRKFEEFCRQALKEGNRIRRIKLENGKAPRSSLHHLGRFWLESLETLGEDGVFILAVKEGGRISIERVDMRSNIILGEIWPMFAQCIFCSGTIRPIDAFSEVIGLDNFVGKEFPSPYPLENIRTFLLRDVTTRGEELPEQMAIRYVNAVDIFLSHMHGRNAAIFASSYRVLQKLIENGLTDVIRERGYTLFMERSDMHGDEAKRVLTQFKEMGRENKSAGILCGVMGGRFAEGADFPGRELESIFLVGIPFERPTVRTKLYIEYYRRIFGEERGRFYAYVLPALKRASQALGRAVRSTEDYATFILGDQRYGRYLELLPDYVQRTCIETSVSGLGSML